MISIVDFGVGNLGSIRNMLGKVGAECELVSDAAQLSRATKLILPGVGSFDAGMSKLERAGLIPALTERVRSGGTDDELLAWCFTHGRRPGDEEILVWNAFMTKRGWRDQASAELENVKRDAGLADRPGIRTFFDFQDADEGRPPRFHD